MFLCKVDGISHPPYLIEKIKVVYMKVLVLSCGTGGGHNSAAKAVVEGLIANNVQANFKEYLEIINVKTSKMVNKLYIKSTTGKGRVFKRVYKIGVLYDKTKLISPVYSLNSLTKRKLYNYIKENNYDYIVTTHLFAAQALTAIKKKHKDIHFIEICTDYTYIPFWKETNPDYIVIPDKELEKDFINKGMNKKTIIPIGIPVAKAFSSELEREKCFADLKLDINKQYILIMTGSMGFGNTLEIIDKLSQNITQTCLVLCGNNKRMKEEITEKYHNNKVVAIGFTTKTSEYMKVCEVLLTKPGGLTTTEAATINIPIIHTMPIPGCENCNADFFQERGMSINCKTVQEICNETQKLLENKELREKMIENQKKHINKNTTEKICELIIQEIEKTRGA